MDSVNITSNFKVIDNPNYLWKTHRFSLSRYAQFYFFVLAALGLSLSVALVFSVSKAVITFFIGITIALTFTLSINSCIMLIFFYYTFEGMIKILSNYNPVVHISGDLLIILVFIRSISDFSSGGLNKIKHTPFLPLFLIFSIWIFVQFFNPLGLGFLPSIAGIKVYLVPMLLLYLTYHHVHKEHIPTIFTFIVILASLMATIALVEFLFGQNFMLSLHPGYIKATREGLFVGPYYRPFATTAVPGMPALWITLVSPIATYLLVTENKNISIKVKFLCLYFLVIGIPVLLLCQVRIAMLQFVLNSILIIGFNRKKIIYRSLYTSVIFFLIISSLYLVAQPLQESSPIRAKQIQMIQDRVLTLTTAKTYQESRDNPFPKFVRGFKTNYYLGMGLSRMGAAGGPWMDRILNHPYINQSTAFWAATSWADNLYLAIFYELGFIGLFAWIAIFFYILLYLFKPICSSIYRSKNCDLLLIWLCICFTISTLLTGMGSEGVLYAPVSIFLWSIMGIGIREVAYANK